MNTQAQSAVSALPDPQAAYDNLFQDVHGRVFFHKCAQAGFAPRTQAQATAMLETSGKLRYAEQQTGVKQAADDNDPIFAMNKALDGVLAQYGLDGGIKQAEYAEDEMAMKEAADILAGDANIYNSVLSLKAYEAAKLQNEYTQWQAHQGAAN